MRKPVLVVGDVMRDIMVLPRGPMRKGSDTPARIETAPGGSGANQAIWLAELGVPTRFVGRAGAADVDALADHFRFRGVDPRLASDPMRQTGTLVCLVEPDGERSFLTDRGANLALCADDLPETLLDGAETLIVSGYALFAPQPREPVRAIIRSARDRGMTVALDPASAGFIADVGADAFLGWCAGVDILFPNVDEAFLLTGKDDPESQIDSLLGHFPAVVLKRGRAGATMARRGAQPVHVRADDCAVLDTTGAGDAFLAGFVAGSRPGVSDSERLDAAIAAASRAIGRVGAQPDPHTLRTDGA